MCFDLLCYMLVHIIAQQRALLRREAHNPCTLDPIFESVALQALALAAMCLQRRLGFLPGQPVTFKRLVCLKYTQKHQVGLLDGDRGGSFLLSVAGLDEELPVAIVESLSELTATKRRVEDPSISTGQPSARVAIVLVWRLPN